MEDFFLSSCCGRGLRPFLGTGFILNETLFIGLLLKNIFDKIEKEKLNYANETCLIFLVQFLR